MTMINKYIWTPLPFSDHWGYLGVFQLEYVFLSPSVTYTLVALLQPEIIHSVCRHWCSILQNTCRKGMGGAGESSTQDSWRPGTRVPALPLADKPFSARFLKITWLGSMGCLCKSHWWWILDSKTQWLVLKPWLLEATWGQSGCRPAPGAWNHKQHDCMWRQELEFQQKLSWSLMTNAKAKQSKWSFFSIAKYMLNLCSIFMI